MQAVMRDQADCALQTAKKRLVDALTDDPLTQQILDMKNEQARLKKEKQEVRRKLKNAVGQRSR
jgi:hypothetical protein